MVVGNAVVSAAVRRIGAAANMSLNLSHDNMAGTTGLAGLGLERRDASNAEPASTTVSVNTPRVSKPRAPVPELACTPRYQIGV